MAPDLRLYAPGEWMIKCEVTGRVYHSLQAYLIKGGPIALAWRVFEQRGCRPISERRLLP
jgi:hypothetical protein